MVFRFASEEDRDAVQKIGTQSVFGIPLILCSLPADFQFDSSPDFLFRVWITLPNLPLRF